MILTTQRLQLRPWKAQDAQNLYEYAKDPLVGPIAGWAVHTSVENSRQIISDYLSGAQTYAVTRREDDTPIGSIGLMLGNASSLELPPNEAELGYWIGVPFWGNGYIPEAAQELIRHGFEALSLSAIWCGYFEGNEKSKRVGEKCGFRFCRKKQTYWPLIDRTEEQIITRLTREEWESHGSISK